MLNDFNVQVKDMNRLFNFKRTDYENRNRLKPYKIPKHYSNLKKKSKWQGTFKLVQTHIHDQEEKQKDTERQKRIKEFFNKQILQKLSKTKIEEKKRVKSV